MSTARETAFEKWITAFERAYGKVTDKMRMHLRTAYHGGFIEGAAQIGDAVKPALQTNIELQRLGLQAHDQMKATMETMADLIGTSVDELRRSAKKNDGN